MTRTQATRFLPRLEALGDRALLSAAWMTMSLARGVLTINGTEGADEINLTVRPVGRRPVGILSVNGRGAFRTNKVRQVVILGNGGDDTIRVADHSRYPFAVAVDGGAGNDAIQDPNRGDLLNGGAGIDTINGVSDAPAPPAVSPITLTPTPVAPRPAPVVPPPAPVVSQTSAAPPATTPPSATVPTGVMTAGEQQIVDQTNQQRAAAGLAPLKVSTQLVRAAEIHAADMARLDQMDHTLSGVDCPTLQSRAQKVGYNYSWLGENIAYNFPDPTSVMSGWMFSDHHRENILNPNFTEIGVAVAYDSLGEPYYCQVFGKPQ